MKKLHFVCMAIAMMFVLISSAQSPTEGYVLYDKEGMPRSVMNLEVAQFSGTDFEIANQYLLANKSWICGGENGNYEFSGFIENPAGRHYSYIQKISGIPVLGAGLVISVNNKHYISHIYNGYKKSINVNGNPAITSQQAINLALSTFDNPNMALNEPPVYDLVIYEDDKHIAYLCYNISIYSYDYGSYQILVDANNSSIIKKTSTEINYGVGTGRVWDPNPAALGIPIVTPDWDGDYPSYLPAYMVRQLQGLNAPEDGMFSLRGEYASSWNLQAPQDPITTQSTPDFIFNRSQNGFEETNCYYHIDKILRFVNSLNIYPTWENQTTGSNKDIVFDARAGGSIDLPAYIGFGKIKYPVPSMETDAGEDESVIVHEVGHAIHDAVLPFGIYPPNDQIIAISEGIANFFGIDHRRQTQSIKPTWASTWYKPGDLINQTSNFTTNWVILSPRTCSGVWAGALFDLEYVSAIDPAQGIRLGREVVTKNQLSALSYLTATSTKEENVLAMYQADLDIYEGLHLREYIDVYHNRQLFTAMAGNDQFISNNITANANWEGYKKINGIIHAISGTTINIAANSVIVMDGELLVDQGATINIGANVRFIGYASTHKVVINGNSTIGNNVTFKFVGIPESTDYFAGLSLQNQSQSVTLNNATFIKSRLFHNGGGLTVNNSTFTDCNKNISYRGNIVYSGCTFTKTGLYFENQNSDANALVTINNYCTMNGQQYSNAIDITGYKKFLIANNSIRDYTNGIRIFNSGLTAPANQIINNNTIFNCTAIGITCYYSYADITMNRIFNNAAGIGLYNASTTKIYGDQYATNVLGTQQIMDNSSYEVLVSRSSFPSLFKWNYISDPDNLGGESDPLIWYLPPTGGFLNSPNVRYNCWGSNFNASQDLYCTTGCSFLYDPGWCPTGKKSGNTYDNAELMFNEALELINTENYYEAKSALQSVVNEHHNTIFAESSLKELFRVESLTSDDYQGLKEYYLTNDSINIAENLSALANYLANKCDEKLGNYQECISWYENMILYSESEEDSIFAVIDLGYLYLLMQNSGLKSIENGNLKQFVPESKSKFEGQRDYLLTLLPGKTINNPTKTQLKNLVSGSLLQNIPNPFINQTEIWYKIEKSANVMISISDQTGRIIKQLKLGLVNGGTNKVDFTSEGLASGMYYYSLVIDGKLSDTKKLTIIK